MTHLDQTAFVVVPRAPYAAWAASLGRPSVEPHELEMFRTVYLVDDVEDLDPEEVLRRHWREVFEHELFAWIEERSTWPKRRTYEMFCEWFEVNVVDHVVKLDGGRPEDE